MLKVLVIEDEQAIRSDIITVLKLEGYETTSAANGRLGVEAAIEHKPDLIICDIRMPILDGYGVLAELRGHESTSTIPFIFLTAVSGRDALRRGMLLGADDYLTKPFSSEDLLAAVKIRLDRHTSLRQAFEKEISVLRQTLITSIPHEFRTPLTSILGYAELLSEDADRATLNPGIVSQMARSIVSAGHRLRHLIENYLLFAQIDILESMPEQVAALRRLTTNEPSRVIEKAVQHQAAVVERAQDVQLEPVDVPVALAEEHLHKIVEELTNNAFKFSRPGSPVKVVMGADEHVLNIHVQDQGRGMSADQIARIGAYMQFNRHIHEQQGSGLGLVIVQRLADLHGGGCSIQSAPGHGTRVTVSLPRATMPFGGEHLGVGERLNSW